MFSRELTLQLDSVYPLGYLPVLATSAQPGEGLGLTALWPLAPRRVGEMPGEPQHTPGLGIICAPPGIKPTTLQLWDNVPTEPPRAGLIIFICTCAHTNAHIQSKCHLFKNNFISKETCI